MGVGVISLRGDRLVDELASSFVVAVLDEQPTLVGERLDVGGVNEQHVVVALDGARVIGAEERSRLGQLTAHRLGDASGDGVGARALACASRDEDARRDRADDDDGGKDRYSPSAPRRGRRDNLVLVVVDRAEHRGGSGRVAVSEGRVVGVVDVARVVLTFEVGQRAQEERALLLELGPLVRVHHRSARGRRQRAPRSSSVGPPAAAACRDHLTNASVSAPAATIVATTGTIHTSAPSPDDGGSSDVPGNLDSTSARISSSVRPAATACHELPQALRHHRVGFE